MTHIHICLSAQHNHRISVAVLPARMEAPAPTNSPPTVVTALKDLLGETARWVNGIC